MKKQWLVYGCIFVFLVSLAAHGNASSGDPARRAVHLADDYQVLADSVVPLQMDAEEVVIEARLPVDKAGGPLESISEDLPHADITIVADRYHGTRWLLITARTAPDADDVRDTALAILGALGPISPDTVQLSLNARWNSIDTYPAAVKESTVCSLFDRIGARTAASMTDERMVSVSGYSPHLSSCIGTGKDETNITASLCDTGKGTVLWLGTPVLTVEY